MTEAELRRTDLYRTEFDPTKDYRSPRPWRVGLNGKSVVSDEAPHGVLHSAMREHARRANAAFIVRACNAHEDLVAGIEAALVLAEEVARGEVQRGLRRRAVDTAFRMGAALSAVGAVRRG